LSSEVSIRYCLQAHIAGDCNGVGSFTLLTTIRHLISASFFAAELASKSERISGAHGSISSPPMLR
jgi:hypothetical protein